MTQDKLKHLESTLEILHREIALVQKIDQLLGNVENHRYLTLDHFIEVGKAMSKYTGIHKYLTSHTPKNETDTRYRLWIGKPDIFNGKGHPDWRDTAVAESSTPQKDSYVFKAITGREPRSRLEDIFGDYETIRSPGDFYCEETRIYRIG